MSDDPFGLPENVTVDAFSVYDVADQATDEDDGPPSMSLMSQADTTAAIERLYDDPDQATTVIITRP